MLREKLFSSEAEGYGKRPRYPGQDDRSLHGCDILEEAVGQLVL